MTIEQLIARLNELDEANPKPHAMRVYFPLKLTNNIICYEIWSVNPIFAEEYEKYMNFNFIHLDGYIFGLTVNQGNWSLTYIENINTRKFKVNVEHFPRKNIKYYFRPNYIPNIYYGLPCDE